MFVSQPDRPLSCISSKVIRAKAGVAQRDSRRTIQQIAYVFRSSATFLDGFYVCYIALHSWLLQMFAYYKTVFSS